MKKGDIVKVKTIPERFGDDKEYQKLIGHEGKVLAVRTLTKEDRDEGYGGEALVKVKGHANPISFEKEHLE
jgi:hypothetical protein